MFFLVFMHNHSWPEKFVKHCRWCMSDLLYTSIFPKISDRSFNLVSKQMNIPVSASKIIKIFLKNIIKILIFKVNKLMKIGSSIYDRF